MTTVLITGANRGIGLALTELYAQRGATVLACCRSPAQAEHLHRLATSKSVNVLPLSVDSDDSVAALAQRLANTTIDILINNAGVIGGRAEKQTATTMDFAAWLDAFNVNTLGPTRVMQALLPNLQRSTNAKVMSVTSQMGALSFDYPSSFAYCATKAALNKFMRLAAIDLKKQGIAIGLVHPGWVQTDMGGPGASITSTASATGIAKVIDQLTLDNAGGFWKWDGSKHEW
jgi:NAD(P)-dependent dehydrogenase (short-subunit alcohol dehydrogenase family)